MIMKKMFIFVLSGLLCNSAVMASGLVDKTIKVDAQNSKIVWQAKKVTGAHDGNVPLNNGTLILDGNKLKGGSFVLDVKNLTVTDVKDENMNGKLTGHLKNDDFFAVDKHPEAKFVITSVSPKSGNQFDVVGNLTIKGITEEIKFPATVTADAKKVTATAKITVDRTKYGIKFRSSNFFENLGDKAISNDFVLDVNLVANK
jgi:polyisoprenoid-binding protein YceI